MKIGFLGMLTLLFAAAKVFGYITWSWLWVFSPLLIPVFTVGLITTAIILAGGKIVRNAEKLNFKDI